MKNDEKIIEACVPRFPENSYPSQQIYPQSIYNFFQSYVN